MNLLITGAGSYIGEKFSEYLQNKDSGWSIFQLDMMTELWKEHYFSQYDAVLHVAGIAHRKITPEIEPLYYRVNRDLAVEVAKKAKENRIRHFVFMSSMSVYSDDLTYVDEHSPTNPDNAYGKSKLQAENEISKLEDDNFIISIVRPPMVYGKGCRGNYNSLRRIALKYPFFPKVNNKRSMLYIDNLCEFLYQIITNPQDGTFYPQNSELVNTTEWAKLIAIENGKWSHSSYFLGACVKLGMHLPVLKQYCVKAFGDCYYDPQISRYDFDYQIVSFDQSIKQTES